MSNLTKRLITGILMILGVLGLLFVMPLKITWFVFLLLFAIGVFEWSHFCRNISSFIPIIVAGLFIGVMLLLHPFMSQYNLKLLFWCFYPVILPVFALLVCTSNESFLKSRTIILGVGCIYLAISFIALGYLLFQTHPNVIGFFVLLLLMWSADTFAYFVGKKYGRHKLAPGISPGKSIEGFVGGVLGALAVGITLFYTIIQQHRPDLLLWQWVFLIGVIVTLSVIGDLFESFFKRLANLKDSGKLIPGHGGVLDRLDSLFMSLPAFAIFWG